MGPVPKSEDQQLDSVGSLDVSEEVNFVQEDNIGAEEESISANSETVRSFISEEDLSSR